MSVSIDLANDDSLPTMEAVNTFVFSVRCNHCKQEDGFEVFCGRSVDVGSFKGIPQDGEVKVAIEERLSEQGWDAFPGDEHYCPEHKAK